MQKKLRRVRGGAEAISPPQFVGLAGRPFSLNETAQHRAEAGDRPRGGGALRGRRLDHRQRRHHDLPDGLSAGGAPDADPDQLVPDRRAPAQALEEHHPAARRHHLPRADDRALAVRERRDPQLLRPADVHGRAGARRARADGGRPAADPGRAEADQPGRRARRAGRRQQVRAALEPDPLRPRPHRRRSSPTTASTTAPRRCCEARRGAADRRRGQGSHSPERSAG